MNNKAVSSALAAILVIAVFVIIGIVVASFGVGNIANQEVSVHIDNTLQTGNYTQQQPLDWGTVQPGFAYTKNFSVTSNSQQNLTLHK